MEAGEEIEDNGNDDTENKARAQRNKDGDVFPSIGNVAGQAANREPGPARNNKHYPNQRDDKTHHDECFSKISHTRSAITEYPNLSLNNDRNHTTRAISLLRLSSATVAQLTITAASDTATPFTNAGAIQRSAAYCIQMTNR